MDMFVPTFLTVLLLAASATDLRTQKIPNFLTFPAIAAALCYHGLAQGLDGLLFGLSGLGLGLALMLVPFFLGVMGAGDVKLLAAVGAWLGAGSVFIAFLFTSLFGGLYALIVLLFHFDVLTRTLQNFWNALMVYLATRRFSWARQEADRRLPRLCYGLAIATGTIAAMIYTNVHPDGLIPG
jgi:prepilin peptidase CpaA